MKYAELWCKTNFSFLEGASHAEELANQAAELGCHALAITDRNSLAGIVRAHQAAKTARLKLLIGAEITPTDGPPVVLIAMNLTGYRNLSQLITRGRRAAEKGDCRLTVDDVAEYAGNLLAVLLPSPFLGRGADPFSPLSPLPRRGEGRNTCNAVPSPLAPLPPGGEGRKTYRDIFADRAYLAAAVHLGPDDQAELDRFAQQARQLRLPLLATNEVYYHAPARRRLHDVLTAVRHHTTVAQLGALRFANAERHLKSPAQMAQLFARYPDAIQRTVEAAERCTFSLDELRYDYPDELCPEGKTPTTYLAELTWAGARERYPAGIPDKVRRLLDKELVLIAELRYEAFFLTVWDLVVFARARGILCQGRGSAANSAVCYCLGITSVDPDRADLLFERFISKERNEAPDIDVDFEHERREEVFQYIYGKYGRERAGIVAEVITYQPRSAVRDVGKALGLSLDAVDRLAKAIDWHSHAFPLTPDSSPARGEGRMSERICEAGLAPDAPSVQHLVELSGELIGFPRHLSQHVGGFVITGRPLSEMVPIENAAMADRTVIEWDKDDLDTLGILKVDCLSLGMLTAIRKCFDLIGALPSSRLAGELARRGDRPVHGEQARRLNGEKLTLATVPAEDAAVYDMICEADTIGVFQIESRAQMSMLPRLQPRCFYDLVIEVAIVRPGPIQGGMVHPFLRRRSGQEPVTYPHPVVEEVLSKTLGVPLFQEQVMRLAIVAAGFTPGEADQLRRAMGAWKRSGVIEKFRDKFRKGLLARGFPAEFADQIYAQIKGFGEYGFPESHAASFALLAYVSAWLKCHYPAAFTAALVNSQPMGFYAVAQLIQDAQAHGVEVLPMDVNESEWDCTLEFLPSPPEGRGEIAFGFSRHPRTLGYASGGDCCRSTRGAVSFGRGFRSARASVQGVARAAGGGGCVSLAGAGSAGSVVEGASDRRRPAVIRWAGRRGGDATVAGDVDAGAGQRGLPDDRVIAEGSPDRAVARRSGSFAGRLGGGAGAAGRQGDGAHRGVGAGAAAAGDGERDGVHVAGRRNGDDEPDHLETDLGTLSQGCEECRRAVDRGESGTCGPGHSRLSEQYRGSVACVAESGGAVKGFSVSRLPFSVRAVPCER